MRCLHLAPSCSTSANKVRLPSGLFLSYLLRRMSLINGPAKRPTTTGTVFCPVNTFAAAPTRTSVGVPDPGLASGNVRMAFDPHTPERRQSHAQIGTRFGPVVPSESMISASLSCRLQLVNPNFFPPRRGPKVRASLGYTDLADREAFSFVIITTQSSSARGKGVDLREWGYLQCVYGGCNMVTTAHGERIIEKRADRHSTDLSCRCGQLGWAGMKMLEKQDFNNTPTRQLSPPDFYLFP
ncbi:RNA polymerase ii subunit, putative [Anopheles sinensis]|uniref:RNA polymerase ii subunit, putative n=1 Tax=Anopheles sinensis TaxID=74873 RepID=A0A084VR15_ANOSI|nr:RNA polymerase ii subunit, putative [Anopheles sinensis]